MWNRCDSLPGPDPGDTLVIYLKEDDTIFVVRAIRFIVSAVADQSCLSTSVCVIDAKLAKFRVQAATRSIERMPTVFEGMVVLVAVEIKSPVFSEDISVR